MIKKFYLFKEAIGSNNPKIQKLVDEANSLLKKLYDNKLEDDVKYSENNTRYCVNVPVTIKYENDLITLEYETIDNEILETSKEKIKSTITRLNFFIKVFNDTINKELKLNNPKYQVLVDKANSLLSKIYEKYGDDAEVYFISRNEAQVYSDFKPLKYENGVIDIDYADGGGATIETNYEDDKTITSILNKWISIFEVSLKENKPYFYDKIDELVTELNNLIKLGNYKITINDQNTYPTYLDVVYKYGKSLKIIFLENGRESGSNYNIEKFGIYTLQTEVVELKKLIKLHKKALLENDIIPLTTLEIENLRNFVNKMMELGESNFYTIIVKPTIDPVIRKNEIVDNLDEDLKKYNTIPGVYMKQTGNYITLFTSYYRLAITIHEQYLSKIYKIYQSVKN
jgi:hypothetical protein